MRPRVWNPRPSSCWKFAGVYNIHDDQLVRFDPGQDHVHTESEIFEGIHNETLKSEYPIEHEAFLDEIELVNGAGTPFELDRFLAGELSPVFFGSAINNYGVQDILNALVEWAPAPRPRATETRTGFAGDIIGIQNHGRLNIGEVMLGAVGILQFETVAQRLESEFGVNATFEPVNIHKALWVTAETDHMLKEFERANHRRLALDASGSLTFLAPTRQILELAKEKWPSVTFHTTREYRGLEAAGAE